MIDFPVHGRCPQCRRVKPLLLYIRNSWRACYEYPIDRRTTKTHSWYCEDCYNDVTGAGRPKMPPTLFGYPVKIVDTLGG